MTIALRADDIIVQVGDSIPAVTGSAWDSWLGWRTNVGTHFAGIGTGIKPYFINRGVPSAYVSTHQTVDNASLIYNAKPSVLVIGLGINEAADSIPAATFETNLTALIHQSVRNSGTLTYARTLIITPWFGGEPTGAYDTRIDDIATKCATVATALGCESLDIRTTRVLTGGQTADGVHPTTAGKAWIVSQIETKFTFDDTVATLTGPEKWRGLNRAGAGNRINTG